MGGGGDRELVEQTVLRELSTVLAPAALTATARALADAEAQHRTRLVAFELAVERARYEADRAPPPVRRGRAGEPVGRPHTWNVPGRTSSVRCAAPRPTCARSRPAGPAALTEQELAWVSRAGAGVRKVFDAPSTTYRDRKQLLRAVIAEVVVTLDRAADVATLRIIWQGGDHTDLTMPLTRAGQHTRTTDEDTVALVGRLAASYDDRTIAQILAKQRRRTGTGLPWTQARVQSLRASRGIAAYRRPAETVVPDDDDAVVVTISEAERQLGVSKFTLYRWLRDGFITGEQLTRPRPGGSGSTKHSGTGSSPKPQPAGSTWRGPHERSASPGRPCCTRSNAASSPPSTSTVDNEKACVSRSFPTRLDCLTTPDERDGQWRPRRGR